MLGAGGTDDSNQFSGVISDDVIKDIYEATKFHPAPVLIGDSTMIDEVYFSSMKINISLIRTTLRSMELGRDIAELMLKGISIEGKVWEKSAIITASVDSAQMLNPFNSQVVLFTKKVDSVDNVLEKQQPSLNIKVDLSPPSCDVDSSVKVILNSTELFCDSEFVKNIVDFLHVLQHLSFQQQRILLSLNGIDDLKSRLLSKIDYVLSSRKKMMWDINLFSIVINIPWENAKVEAHNTVIEVAAISFTSKSEIDSSASHMGDRSHLLNRYVGFGSSSIGDTEMGFQLQDLYDHFEIQINDTQIKLVMPSSATIPLFEKFSASASLVSCILPDEHILKGLEVRLQVPSLVVHFSASIYGEIMGLISQFNMLLPPLDSMVSLEIKSNGLKTAVYPWFSIDASLDAICLLVKLEDNVADGCTLNLNCQKLGVWYDRRDFPECWASVQACWITASSTKDDWGNHVLCSTGSMWGSESVSQHNMGVNFDGESGHLGDGSSIVDGCIVLLFEAPRDFLQKYTISATDLDIHCYPFIVGQLVGFLDKIVSYGESDTEGRKPNVEDPNSSRHGFELQQYGLSTEIGSYESASIPLDHSSFTSFRNLRFNIENIVHMNLLVRCDSLDVSLSNHILYVFHFTWFKKSEEMPSQFNLKRMDLKVQLRKFSLLLTDWKRTSNGPLLEFLVRNSIFWSTVTEDEIEGSVGCDLQVNYYSIDKVLWEPFVEPWKFQLSMSRKQDERTLFSGAIMTDINLESKTHLNLNLNEPIIEVVSRAIEMIEDAWSLMKMTESPDLSNSQITKSAETRRYAPYMLQNLTTLPLVFHVCQRKLGDDDLDVTPSKGVLQPGSSTLVYINESPEELLFRYRPVQSSDRLNDKQLLEAAHRYVTFQLEGTSVPSAPISMDLVGRRYFEVEFSKSSHVSEVHSDANSMKINRKIEGDGGTDAIRGFAVPVVIDVSVQRFTKLMRLYSTVVILNSTSVLLEVRFDIPFGVSPKIFGPIYPGQEFPLPLHLAEAGCIRWRPLGDSYLWSEAYNISSIISQDSLPPVGRVKRVYSPIDVDSGKQSQNFHSQSSNNLEIPRNRFLYQRLRIYQPKCESFETVIHPYTSFPYAWDEPCYPHRLNVEVPGERILGSYAIDDASAHSLLYLPATSEKPERNFLISVHSEGAIKVLSIIDSSYHVLNDLKSLHVPQLKDKGKQTQNYESFVHYKERFSVDIPFLGVSLMNSHPEELLFACAKSTKVNFVQSLDRQQFSLQIASLQIDNQLRTTPYPVILSFNRGNKGNVVNQMKFKDNGAKLISGSMSQIASSNLPEPVFSLDVAKWRNTDTSLVSFEYISLRISDIYLEIEQEIVLRLFEFCKTSSSRLQSRVFQHMDSTQNLLFSDSDFAGETSRNAQYSARFDEKHLNCTGTTLLSEDYRRSFLLPHIVPIGAPWQQIHLAARKQKKIYVELFDMGPIKLTLSFSSSPWILRNGVLTSGESLIHRGLMALADVEGAKIHFKQLVLSHQIASWESIQEILVSHYTRQFLHEMYKVTSLMTFLTSVWFCWCYRNPVGFARSLGLGIKDFFSLPVWSVFQSPSGLITGMAQGTTSLLSNTVYAISDATSQFSKAAHKGIVAFAFDDQTATMIERQQKGMSSHSKGVINEFLEGLTGVLQSPIKGAEKHGLPGVLSGIAVGVTGLLARPAASILEVTGKTAQSIRNRSRIHQMGYRCFRVRLPRPLSAESPLKPYSWEEAVGTYVLNETDMKLRDETLVMCKALKLCGQYVLITGRLILVVSCSSLIDLGTPNFEGVPADPKWVIQSEIAMDSVILADNDGEVVHIVGSGSDTSFRQNLQQQKRGNEAKGKLWNNFHTPLPLLQTNLEFTCPEEADEFLRVLRCMIERGKEQGWGSVYILHQSNIK
ncbi:hypothetical protein Pfo_024615 [Paulownia fortunei]|nr:hypothetical protein Pfo_024615 [Paulownia fortunei]